MPRGFMYGGYLSNEEHPLIMIGGVDENGNSVTNIMEYQREFNTIEILPGKLNTARKNFGVSGMYNSEDC